MNQIQNERKMFEQSLKGIRTDFQRITNENENGMEGAVPLSGHETGSYFGAYCTM